MCMEKKEGEKEGDTARGKLPVLSTPSNTTPVESPS